MKQNTLLLLASTAGAAIGIPLANGVPASNSASQGRYYGRPPPSPAPFVIGGYADPRIRYQLYSASPSSPAQAPTGGLPVAAATVSPTLVPRAYSVSYSANRGTSPAALAATNASQYASATAVAATGATGYAYETPAYTDPRGVVYYYASPTAPAYTDANGNVHGNDPGYANAYPYAYGSGYPYPYGNGYGVPGYPYGYPNEYPPPYGKPSQSNPIPNNVNFYNIQEAPSEATGAASGPTGTPDATVVAEATAIVPSVVTATAIVPPDGTGTATPEPFDTSLFDTMNATQADPHSRDKPRAIVLVDHKVLWDDLTILGNDWMLSYEGEHRLRHQIAGCGLVTEWNYNVVDDTVYDAKRYGFYDKHAIATFRLPLIRKQGCPARAIESAGGPVATKVKVKMLNPLNMFWKLSLSGLIAMRLAPPN